MPFIDAMRGLAALGVVLFHAVEGNHIPYLLASAPWLSLVIELGHFGVPIFFVLSGFVIALSLDGKSMNLQTVGRFMLRRSIRLDPPYWIAIILGISVIFAKQRSLEGITIGQIVAHLFYVQGLLGYKQISVVFWTLCMEVQFYLTYALLMSSTSRQNALSMAMIVSLLWPMHLIHVMNENLFLQLWHGFLLGVCAYWVIYKQYPLWSFVVYAGMIMLFGDSFSLACALMASVILTLGLGRRLHYLGWGWLQGLGAISYSLYLVHNPVTGVIFRFADGLGGHSAIKDAVFWAASIAACLMAAVAMWLVVERPAMALARRAPLEPTRSLKRTVGETV